MSDLRTAAQQALERPNLLGWSFHRNSDGSIGIKSPPPRPGESKRTSDCVYPCNGADLHELLSKFVDHIAALEQEQEPEPVAWMFQHDETGRINFVVNYGMMAADEFIKVNPRYTLIGSLYTHPPRREWRGLTEEEIVTAVPDEPFDLDFAYARAIEAALKERNA